MPWLAASGPLSYTPESPPPSDYYFQYSWILPGIFDLATNKRRHFYFGAHYKDDAKELFSFWASAREGRAVSVACHFGGVDADTRITTPVAIYSALDTGNGPCYLFMQHGSYQFVPTEDQAHREQSNQAGLRKRARLLLHAGKRASRADRVGVTS